jgi:hypothetical protein
MGRAHLYVVLMRRYLSSLALRSQVVGRKPHRRKFARKKTPGRHAAFVRLQTLGSTGRPALASVHAKYRDLVRDEPDHEDLQAAERLSMSARAKPAPARGSYFGLSSREVRRKSDLLAKRARFRHIMQIAPDERAMQLALMDRGKLAVTDYLKGVRTVARLESEARRIEAKEDELILDRYRAGAATEVQKKLESSGAISGKCEIVALPSCSSLAQFLVYPSRELAMAGDVVGAMNSAQARLGGSLEQQWKQLHRLHTGENVTDDLLVKEKVSRCRQAACCVCKEPGKTLLRFRNSFFRGFKPVFAPGSDNRLKLTQCFIVVMFVGELISNPSIVEEHLFHMSYPLLSPYRPTLLKLRRAADPGEVAPLESRIYVEELNDYGDEFKMFKHWPKVGWAWTFMLYELENTIAICAYLAPSVVPIVPMKDAEKIGFWGIDKKERVRIDIDALDAFIADLATVVAAPAPSDPVLDDEPDAADLGDDDGPTEALIPDLFADIVAGVLEDEGIDRRISCITTHMF